MSGRFPPKTVSPTRPVDGVSPALFRRQRFLRRLAVYRPLGVLASIWVVFLAIALLAYGQLMRTAPERENAASSASLESYPHERLEGASNSAEPNADVPSTEASLAVDGAAETADGDRVGEDAEVVDTGVNLWTVLALVGTCALGCWLLSVLLKSPPKRRKVRRKKPALAKGKAINRPTLDRPTGQPPLATKPKSPVAPPKLDPYDPEQPLIKATAARQASQSSQTPAPSPAAESSSDVSVVAEEFQHRLDWPEDSLINAADVRQRRSLSSFL